MDRKYFEIWKQLKSLPREVASTTGVRISAPRALHKRIIKATRKEKWMDFSYKISIEPRVAVMYAYQSNSIITFVLKFNIIAEDF